MINENNNVWMDVNIKTNKIIIQTHTHSLQFFLSVTITILNFASYLIIAIIIYNFGTTNRTGYTNKNKI